MRVYPPRDHVLCQMHLAFEPAGEGRLVGTMPLTPFLCGPDGSIRLAALATGGDLAAGVSAVRETRPDHTATFDLAFHLVEPVGPGGEADLECRLVRAGRNTVVTKVDVSVRGSLVATGTISYSRRPLPDGFSPVKPNDHVDLRPDQAPLAVPLGELVGFRPEGASIGFDLVKPIQNSFGSVQGGVTALAMEEAALHAVGEGRVAFLHVYYLAGAREGPFLATPTAHGTGRVTTVETELHDVPAERLLAIGTAIVER